jgi:hypothetical protein
MWQYKHGNGKHWWLKQLLIHGESKEDFASQKKIQEMFNGKQAHTHTHTHTNTRNHTAYVWYAICTCFDSSTWCFHIKKLLFYLYIVTTPYHWTRYFIWSNSSDFKPCKILEDTPLKYFKIPGTHFQYDLHHCFPSAIMRSYKTCCLPLFTLQCYPHTYVCCKIIKHSCVLHLMSFTHRKIFSPNMWTSSRDRKL